MTHPPLEIAALVNPRGVIPADRVAEWIDRSGEDIEAVMMRLLPVAANCARAPVSRFSVGAVTLGNTGCLYLGANLEFTALPLAMSVHAEQAAIHNAWLHGETHVKSLAVTAPPCGHCRQFLQELVSANSLEILVAANDSAANRPYTKHSLAELLPLPFGPADLSNADRLMGSQRITLSHRPTDKLVQKALEAAERSYAPYTGNRAGVALQSADGEVFLGRITESAAFNPTLSPMAGALSQLALARHGQVSGITAAALVESPTRMSQRDVSQSLLSSVASQVDLTYLGVAYL